MAVKFPLKMADGALVRTLEDLRAHFDLASVLSYYENGRLKKWLENGYYDAEAKRVSALNAASPDFTEELCEILGVSCSSSVVRQVDLGVVAVRNKRLERLKQFTADDTILASVDRAVFTQDELNALMPELRHACARPPLTDSRKEIVYLCGKYFILPGSVDNIKYVGKNFLGATPKFSLDSNPVGAGVVFQDLELDMNSYRGNGARFFQSFAQNKAVGFQFLQVSAEKSALAMALLGECLQKGFGVDQSAEEAVKWYCEAAKLGNARAQSKLGHCYRYGEGIAKDISECVKWSQKAAEQGDADAQTRLGILYERGDGVEKDLKKAAQLYQKAAEQGHGKAQYYLGLCYKNGCGVVRNKKRAVEWLKKAYAQGVKSASAALIETAPELFKLSDVILYALGGEKNLVSGAKLDRANGTIVVPVQDRHKVKEPVLRDFGANKVQIEEVYHYYTYTPEGNPLEKAAAEAIDVIVCIGENIPIIQIPFGEIRKNWDAAKNGAKKTAYNDFGWGRVHILLDITADMENDFNNDLLPRIKKEQFSCQGN